MCNLAGSSFHPEDTLTVSLTVINTGDVAGAEVVQLYIADQQPGDDRPPQSLKGFKKLWLGAG